MDIFEAEVARRFVVAVTTAVEDEPQTCSVSGRPYTDCSRCEYFRCTADEPLTKCDLCKREGDDICVDCERKKQSGRE